MFNRTQLQARNHYRFRGTRMAYGYRDACEYPEVPAGWPNRATRRAVKQNRFSRLTGDWRAVLVQRPELVQAIRVL